MTYGAYVPEGEPVSIRTSVASSFIALNASLFRQFEFVQQQWMQYGNDALQGNDKTTRLPANHIGKGKFRGARHNRSAQPAIHLRRAARFLSSSAAAITFFMPGLTALHMMAAGTVDPR